jgi:hypothetical protein
MALPIGTVDLHLLPVQTAVEVLNVKVGVKKAIILLL